MYIKWQDIETEVLEEAGITKEQLDQYVDKLIDGVRNVRDFRFCFFGMGFLTFKPSFFQRNLKYDDHPLLENLTKALLKSYEWKCQVKILEICKYRALQFGLKLPLRAHRLPSNKFGKTWKAKPYKGPVKTKRLNPE